MSECCRDDRFDIAARQERDRLRAALEEIASIDPTGVPELRLPIELASASLSNPTATTPEEPDA